MEYLTLMSTSSGLSDIVSFFNNYATSGDVDGALVSAGFLFKAVLWLIIFVGAISMAIWIGRIAVDILLLVTRGTKVAESGLKKFGTGKDGAAADVKSYIGQNGVEILLMIVLITFLITGWLFRLVAIALSGFGALGNKLFNLDLEASFTTTEITSYKEQLPARRAVSLKTEYDEMLSNTRAEAVRLYGYAKEGKLKTEANYQKASKMYSTYIMRAQAIADVMTGEKAASLNVKADYFNQHLSVKGDELCNESFIDDAIREMYISAGVATISCGSTGSVVAPTTP